MKYARLSDAEVKELLALAAQINREYKALIFITNQKITLCRQQPK